MVNDSFDINTTQLITLGIVVYNTSIFVLEDCFSSIKNSSIKPIVIVLCNSEENNYIKQVEVLTAKYNFQFIISANEGFGEGHNKIVSTIKTEWYICCNPDIQIGEDSIQNLLDAAQNLNNPVQIAPKILNADGSVQKLCKKHLSISSWLHRQLWRLFPNAFKPFEEKFDYNKSPQIIEFVSGCFFLIKTALYLKNNGFSNEFFLYCEDADFSKRASKLGFNYYVANSIVIHKWGKAYLASFKHLKFEIKSLFIYFLKHGFFTTNKT